MKYVTATLFSKYSICKRQVWLFSRELNPNQDDDYLVLGRMIHENSYKRKKKEIIIDGCKFDLVDNKSGKTVIGEVKKSSKAINSSIMQLKYYLYVLRNKGLIYNGELRVPKEKKVIEVKLSDDDVDCIEKIVETINNLLDGELPPVEKCKYCSKCAYYDFCWS